VPVLELPKDCNYPKTAGKLPDERPQTTQNRSFKSLLPALLGQLPNFDRSQAHRVADLCAIATEPLAIFSVVIDLN
jgi:hypothetical protein